MEFTRRNILALGSGAFAAASFAGMPAFASKTDDAIAAFTGGASVAEGGIELTAPEIAENGNTVPVSVSSTRRGVHHAVGNGQPDASGRHI